MDKILEILRSINDKVDYTKETKLVSGGIYESFDIIMCVNELEDAFDIEIPPEEIIAENFESAEAVHKMVEKVKSGA